MGINKIRPVENVTGFRAMIMVTAFAAALLYSTCACAWSYPEKLQPWNETYGEISTGLVFCDIDGDGFKEIVFGTKKGYVFSIRADGSRPRFVHVGGSIKADLMMVDLNRDIHADIVAFVRDSRYDEPARRSFMVVIDGKSFTETSRVELDGSVVSRPAVWDFNGDGNADFLIPSRGILLVDGKASGKFKTMHYAVGGTTFSSPVVADFNGDGIPDFMIAYTRDSRPFMDVFISSGRPFAYARLTFPLKNELRVIPTLIGGESGSWRLAAPSFDKAIDFYSIKWDARARSLSFAHDGSFTEHDTRYARQLSALRTQSKGVALPLYVPQTKRLWLIDPATAQKISDVPAGKFPENIPVYALKQSSYSGDSGDSGGAGVPAIVLMDEGGLYGVSPGRQERTLLSPPPPGVPPLREFYLFAPSKTDDVRIAGITEKGEVFVAYGTAIKLALINPNAAGYLNQGVQPPDEMETLAKAVETAGDSSAAAPLGLAEQLYPGSDYFKNRLAGLHTKQKEKESFLSDVSTLKDEIRRAAAKYTHAGILRGVLHGKLSGKMEYFEQNDPAFLSEPQVAAFYKDYLRVREFLRLIIPLSAGVALLVVLVFLVFNYPYLSHLYYGMKHRKGVQEEWHRVILDYEGTGRLSAYLHKSGFLTERPSQLFDFKFSMLLAMLLESGSYEWHRLLRLYEENIVSQSYLNESELKNFYKYLLLNYRRLLYLRIKCMPLGRRLAFRLRNLLAALTFDKAVDFHASDLTLLIIKYNMARCFLNMGGNKPALNYLHELVLEAPLSHDPRTAVHVNLDSIVVGLQEHRIEYYFFKYRRTFFRRVRVFEDRLKVLYFYKGRQLRETLETYIDDMLRETLRLFGLPKVVVEDYIPSGPLISHGAYFTLKAFSRVRRIEVVLRCIPSGNPAMNIADSRLKNLSDSNDNVCSISNVHRNKHWLVQVESYVKHPSLSAPPGVCFPPATVKRILLYLTGFALKNSPLWFIPHIEPSKLFWDGHRVYLAASGISKPLSDRETLKRNKRTSGFMGELYQTPEFAAEPDVEALLDDPEAVDKTVVYLLGLLAVTLLGGKPFYGIDIDPSFANAPTAPPSCFPGAENVLSAALLPAAKRPSLSEFEALIKSIYWPCQNPYVTSAPVGGGATPGVNGGATPGVNGGATPGVNGGATPGVNRNEAPGVNRNDMFYGRAALLDSMARHIGGFQCAITVLSGISRIGRTSVLQRLQSMAAADGIEPALVSLSSIDAGGRTSIDAGGRTSAQDVSFWEHVLKTAYDALNEKRKYLYLMSHSNLHLSKNPYQAALEFMEINLKISGFRLVVILDDFEVYCAEFDSKRRLQLVEELRSMAAEFEGKLAFVVTASPFGETPEPGVSESGGVVEIFDVELLDADDSNALVGNPGGVEFGFTDDAVTRILRAGGGHPYLIQCLCHALVEDKNRHKTDRNITGDDVRRVYPQALSAVTEYFEELWERGIDEAARKTLSEAAAGRSGHDSALQNPAMAAFLHDSEKGTEFRSALFKDWIAMRFKDAGGVFGNTGDMY